MVTIGVILVIIAALLAILDIVLSRTGNARSWFLSPVAILLLCVAYLLNSGLIK